LKQFFQSASGNATVVLHVEPDLWGYLERIATVQDDATTVPVSVASSGFADVSAYPNNLRGFAQAIVHLRDLYARNVLLGYHISVWGTNVDISIQNPAASVVTQLGQRAGTYFNSLQANFDLAFAEFSDRDSGFYEAIATDSTPCAPGKVGCNHWWDETDYTNSINFISTFVQMTSKRVVFWQIPFGNTKMRACDNTLNHYQDTRPEWLLDNANKANIARYRDAGVIGFLFGGGSSATTCACDAAGDGVTNPNPINGNTLTSLSSDDDGGYFMQKASIYNQSPLSLVAGATTPQGTSQNTVRTSGTPTTVATSQNTVGTSRAPTTVATSQNIVVTSKGATSQGVSNAATSNGVSNSQSNQISISVNVMASLPVSSSAMFQISAVIILAIALAF